MDFTELLKNDSVKGLLKQFGVPDDKADSVAEEAAGSIKAKYEKNPEQMKSLLSKNKNTDKDEALKKEVEGDFLENLVKKVGLPASVASQVTGALPGLLEQVGDKIPGVNADMIENVTDMLKGDKSGSSKGGILSKIMSFFKK